MPTDSSRLYKYPRQMFQRGVSLVELVVFIVIVSLSVAGILLVMNVTTRHSADPMIQEQALLIAESYMKEILMKRFYDDDTNNVCPGPEGGGRIAYDNVCDYNGLNDNSGARDQFGNAISGLERYNVAVTVTNTGVTLGPTVSQINNTGVIRVLRVDVTVTHDNVPDLSVPLTGYRTHYACFNVGDNDCQPL